MTRTTQGSIYALIDPRDSKIRYIGKTTQPVLTRLAGHLAQPTNPAMRAWIASLSLQGFIPRAEVVATASEATLDAEEQRQIQRHAREGHRLFNSPYYKQHLADLNRPAARASKAKPVRPQRETVERRTAWWFFGSMVQARSASRVPAWWAFCFVVACSPLYCSAVILHHLLGVRVVRRLLTASACAWPLWESGFDKAVRELLLAHLPLSTWATLWAEYAAAPLRTLAGDMLWPAVITVVMLTAGMYDDIRRCPVTGK
jgi:hypothetical protein